LRYQAPARDWRGSVSKNDLMVVNNAKRKALIVGGGIGGLASALALQRVGCDVRVFERAAEIREVGAGLALWSGTVALLRMLGIADEVIASGGQLERSQMLTWRGEVRSDLRVADLDFIRKLTLCRI
jgi:2-polyprenyl-6-methoxyphenol hydroxylase-like FAD-dependent oxidoreductase